MKWAVGWVSAALCYARPLELNGDGLLPTEVNRYSATKPDYLLTSNDGLVWAKSNTNVMIVSQLPQITSFSPSELYEI